MTERVPAGGEDGNRRIRSRPDASVEVNGLHGPVGEARPVRGRTLAILVLLMVLGGIFRFNGLTETGPFFIDHGDYMLEGRWLYEATLNLLEAVPQWIREGSQGLALEFKEIFRRSDGQPMVMGRPLHMLLIAVPMFLTGYRPDLGNLVSAFFGVLSIPLVYFLYRRLYGETGAGMAAALVSVMGIHVHYSRNAFSETDSTFFLLLSLLFYARSRDRIRERSPMRILCLSGLAWGLAGAAHDRWLGIVLALWILEGHLWLVERAVTFGEAFRRFTVLNVMVLVPLAVFELPYLVVRIAAAAAGKGMPFQSYFQILVHHIVTTQAMTAARFIKGLHVSGFRFSDLAFLPDILIRYNGYLYTGLFLVGLVTLIRRRGFADICLLACMLIPAVLIQISVFHCMRYYSLLFPLMAIVCSRGIVLFGLKESNVPGHRETARRSGHLGLVLFFVTFGSGIHASSKEVRFPFGYPEAARHISDQGWKVMATNEKVLQGYLGKTTCKAVPVSEEELLREWESGYQYLVVDFAPVVWDALKNVGVRHKDNIRRLAMIESIRKGNPPEAVFPNPGAAWRDNLFEALFNYRDAFELSDRIQREGADTIRIYKIPKQKVGKADAGSALQ